MHLNCIKVLKWSLNPHVLPAIGDHQIGSPISTVNNDQTINDMSDPVANNKAQLWEQINHNIN